MRIDFGLVLCIVLECIFFLYYADTLFYKKRSNAFCVSVIISGYIVHFIICIFGNMVINTLFFFFLNVIALIGCYHISNKNAIFQGAMLTALSIGGELAIASIGRLRINLNDIVSISPVQSFIITIAGKLLYLVGIMILTHIFKKKQKRQ